MDASVAGGQRRGLDFGLAGEVVVPVSGVGGCMRIKANATGGFSPAGAIAVLLLFLLFVAGLLYLAWLIWQVLQQIAPPPPNPPPDPNSNVEWSPTSPPPPSWFDETAWRTWLFSPTSSASTASSAVCYRVERSADLIEWKPALSVTCLPEDIHRFLGEMARRESSLSGSNCAFYKALAQPQE